MSIDTSFGEFRQFEDFNVTAIANKAEISVTAISGGTTEVTAGADGRLRINGDGTGDEQVGGVSFGRTNWVAGDGYLKMEARIVLDTIADYKLFIGFATSLASASETTFSATSDTVTIDTITDGIGIVKDGDSSTDALFCVAGDTNTVTVSQQISTTYNPVATTFTTIGCYLSLDRTSAQFYVDGKEVYRVDGSTALVAAIALVPGVWVYDQSTGTNHDVDYLYGAKGRSVS